MSGIEHYTDLSTWRKAHQLFLDILNEVEEYPSSRGADVVAEQILRSSSSVSANISEGFGRSQKRFVNCLDIAQGEANETENWLYKVRDAGFLDRETVIELLKRTIEVQKMVAALKKNIRETPNAIREISPEYATS